MKHEHLIIPTYAARHFFSPGSPLLQTTHAHVHFPAPNKEGLYWFPDNEVYLRVPGLTQAKKILVVHAGYPNPNRGLIELFMLLDIIAQNAPKTHVYVLFTVMPYARQDKAYYAGEINAAKTLLGSLQNRYGVNGVFAIDAHFADESWTKKCRFMNISAVDLLKKRALELHPDMIFMAPDAGSARRAHLKGAKKQRKNSYEVNVRLEHESTFAVRGKNVGVVDDLLSTGTTLERFHTEAKRYGAKKVFALVTHGVNQSGIDRTLAHYDGLYITNSIKIAEANVSVLPLIDSTIKVVFK